MKRFRYVAGWLLALVVLLLRLSIRVRVNGDPRPALRAARSPYLFAILHCHQIGAVVACEKGTGAMVSRSGDGDLLVPSLRVHGITPYRGSTGTGGKDKGGADALGQLIEHVRRGAPGYLAVDGPRGPRNHVHRGIARLAAATGAAVLVAIPVPVRRWILRGAWDRLQIPKPLTRIDVYFGPALRMQEGEEVEAFCGRIEAALRELEARHDPVEAAAAAEATERRRLRLAAQRWARAGRTIGLGRGGR